MGLGFSMKLPAGRLAKKSRKQYEQYFGSLKPVIPDWNPVSTFEDAGFLVKLVPFEEEIYGTWENGDLRISAKTSSAGPGYHAYLVDLIDGLGVAPLEVKDDTGYYDARNYSALQDEMSGWLRILSEQLIKMGDSGQDYAALSVSLRIDGFPEATGHFACCPLGYYEREFVEMALSGQNLGPEFFVWWNQQQDALFYRNAALCQILSDVNWLMPRSSGERLSVSSALGCLEIAFGLDPYLAYPAAEWLELARLSGDAALAEAIRSRFGAVGQATLGYNRGIISSEMHGWRFSHSGMMHAEFEDEGETYVHWDGKRTIRVSSLTVEFNGNPPNKSEMLLASATAKESYEPFRLRNADIPAKILHKQIEENGKPLWSTSLNAAMENELLVMSLYYEDEADREWALGVCASVAR
jgi:hypothetical protein